jgi:hypothetical protein
VWTLKGVRMKQEKRHNVLLEKLTLAEARERVEEFKDLKPIDGKSGVTAATPPTKAKGSARKGKR